MILSYKFEFELIFGCVSAISRTPLDLLAMKEKLIDSLPMSAARPILLFKFPLTHPGLPPRTMPCERKQPSSGPDVGASDKKLINRRIRRSSGFISGPTFVGVGSLGLPPRIPPPNPHFSFWNTIIITSFCFGFYSLPFSPTKRESE